MSRVASSCGKRFTSSGRVATSLCDFIGGPENALTELAAVSVTHQWVRFNPLFISGPAGVGKTHLLHCLLDASRIAYSDLRSLWLTGADYARAIANGIDVDSLGDVRNMHRCVDLLILDGLHELAAKPLAQQELAHTIDFLLEQDGQVIVSSRSALEEISSMSPALTSRLSSGLHIPMVPPAAATRRVILEELAQQNEVAIPPQIIRRLTSDSASQRSKPFMVNDLSAAVAELICFSDRADDTATESADRFTTRSNHILEVTAKEINKSVAKYFNVTVRELTGTSRRKSVVRARALSVYLIRTVVGSSFQAIGRDVGGRDHSTVMHAFRRAKEWMNGDAGFAKAVIEVRAALE